MPPDINQLLGVGSAALLLLLAALLFRDYSTLAVGRLAIAFALGAAAHALTASTRLAASVTPGQAALVAISTANAVVFWLFARALFDDAFSLRRWHLLPWAALLCLSLTNCLGLVPAGIIDRRVFAVAISLLSLGFVALAVGQTIASWSADLVEERRRLRVFLVVSAAAYAGFSTIAQLLAPAGWSTAVASIEAVILAAIVIASAYSLLRVRGERIFPALAPPPTAAPVAEISRLADRRLLDALKRLMADERIYRHEGITIGALANRLAVPEYKLRRLINQHLGYRNFNAFLNNHRIEEAKAALADPSQAGVPVITIALDAGFQSLGPFNRAFKATTGVTPTEYRRLGDGRVGSI